MVKVIKDLNKWRDIHVHGQEDNIKMSHLPDRSYIPYDPNQNPRKLFCGCQWTDSKVYVERQRQQSKQDTQEKEHSWRINTTQLQDLRLSYDNIDERLDS